jgi:hypothetical protein
MKTPLAFLAGAGVGALAMWLALPKAATPPTPEQARQETARQDARKGDSPGTGEGGMPAKTRRPSAAAEDDDSKILDEDDMDSPEMRGIREAMAKELAERKGRRLDERVAALKSRLNLDDATAAKVRALLEGSEEEEDRVMDALEGTERSAPIEPGELTRKRAALDESIAKILNPTQATAYKEFAAEQKENRIEVATGREMSRLQSALTLTPDQKDKVYQALNGIAAREEEDGRQFVDLDPAELKARQQARLDAMRPLLTPQQFAEYERRSISSLRAIGEPAEDDHQE